VVKRIVVSRKQRDEKRGDGKKLGFAIRLRFRPEVLKSPSFYCTVNTIVLLVTWVPEVVFVMVAVMLVVPAATLVANPLPLLRPELIVATFVFDDVQVTAFVRSLLFNPFP